MKRLLAWLLGLDEVCAVEARSWNGPAMESVLVHVAWDRAAARRFCRDPENWADEGEWFALSRERVGDAAHLDFELEFLDRFGNPLAEQPAPPIGGLVAEGL